MPSHLDTPFEEAGVVRHGTSLASSKLSEKRTSSYCYECKGSLTGIDNRGQLLKGCMTTLP
jgi:hypothetical protein